MSNSKGRPLANCATSAELGKIRVNKEAMLEALKAHHTILQFVGDYGGP